VLGTFVKPIGFANIPNDLLRIGGRFAFDLGTLGFGCSLRRRRARAPVLRGSDPLSKATMTTWRAQASQRLLNCGSSSPTGRDHEEVSRCAIIALST
jgi:hypothetical protein